MSIFSSFVKTIQVFSITAEHIKEANKTINFQSIKKSWADKMAGHFHMTINKSGFLQLSEEPAIFVGNHVSYLDIPVLLSCVPQVSFVSKKEVKNWPVIGGAAEKAGTLFVDRQSAHSRQELKNEIARSVIEKKLKLAIFPSGTTSMNVSKFWRKGAFEIAAQNDIIIIPFRIRYEPLRKAAYIDKDNFLLHLIRLFKLKDVQAYIDFHPPVKIADVETQTSYWKEWSENF